MSRRRYAREDWIALGQQRLARDGPDAVKLAAICKAAGLTRGSFYHHFDDHQGFLVALAEAWLTTGTTDIAGCVDASASPQDGMDALTTVVMTIDYRLELGIRELARRLPAVHDIVARADAQRLDVLAALYARRFGLDDGVARSYAYLEYAAFSGLILLDPELAEARQQALATLYADMVSQVLDPQGRCSGA